MTRAAETLGPPPGDDPARLLNRRYFGAFAVVVSLVLLNQLLVQPPLLRLAIDAPTINVAGRQRMLSQKLAKSALAADRAAGETERRTHLRELDDVLRLWSSAHSDLRRGLALGRTSDAGSAAIRGAFDELDLSFTRMRDAAAALIRALSELPPDVSNGRDALSIILASERDYLPRMDRIVGLYESEARARITRLLWTGRAVTALIIAALIGIGAFILRPATRVIQRQVRELRRHQDELEGRVVERTRALEQANRDLAREAEERSRAEARHRAALEMLSHASRTNVLGEMAGGLAHELNQPLGAIANYAEGCLVELDRERPQIDEVQGALRKIRSTTLRAGEMIRRIRRFVTRHGPEREPFAPNRIVEDVAELVRDEAARRGITVHLDLAPELPSLLGDPIQIQQVLVNLVRNAFEAVAASKSETQPIVMGTQSAGPEAVEFRVTDRGEGIPNELLGRVFDAYFSTRAEGMGMGLAISRTIVEAHHGKLFVESVPGVETTFRFTLPVAGREDDAGTNDLRGGR